MNTETCNVMTLPIRLYLHTFPGDYSIDLMFVADDEDFVLGQTSSGRATAIAFSTLGDAMCINVTIVNDDVREPNETVMLSPIPGIPTDRVVGENFTMVILDDGDGELYVIS